MKVNETSSALQQDRMWLKVQLLHGNALSDDEATAELLFMVERQLRAPITCCHMLRFYQTLFILACCGKKQNGTILIPSKWVTEEKNHFQIPFNVTLLQETL